MDQGRERRTQAPSEQVFQRHDQELMALLQQALRDRLIVPTEAPLPGRKQAYVNERAEEAA
jgi:hypothetical protein